MRADILQNLARNTREALGEPVEYQYFGGKRDFVEGVFKDTAQLANPNGGALVLTAAHSVTIARDDLSGTPSNKDRVVIRGVSYRVMSKMESGRLIKFELQGV